jgi:hypothetical protein
MANDPIQKQVLQNFALQTPFYEFGKMWLNISRGRKRINEKIPGDWFTRDEIHLTAGA